MKRSAARLAGLLIAFAAAAAAQACGGGAADLSIPPDEDAGAVDGDAQDAQPDATGDGSEAHDGEAGADVDATAPDADAADAGGDAADAADASADGGDADASDGSVQDASDASTPDASDAFDGADAADAGDGGACPDPDLGDADQHVYVDQGAAPGGNGSLACPLRTILDATALGGTPLAGWKLTIHVKGGTPAVVYDESACVPIGARTTLTSDYPGGGGADPDKVTVRGQSTIQGSKCVVRVTGGTLEGVRVVAPAATSGVNGVVASDGAAVRDVTAKGLSASGVLTFGSVTLGPGVFATDNGGDGLTATMAANKASVPVVSVLAGGRGNRFDQNAGHGIHASDRYGQLAIEQASASNNVGTGVFIEPEPTSQHAIVGVNASDNGIAGLRIVRGPAAINGGTFDGNAIHGVYVSTGASYYLQATQANGNGGDGVRLDAQGSVEIVALTARGNGASNATGTGAGLYVAHGTSAHLRGSVLLENKVGLYFDQVRTSGGAAITTLDLGTSDNDLGGNTFAATPGTSNNELGGLCILHSGAALSQKAVGDLWATCPPLQVPIVSAGQNPDCYDAAAYGDVIYLPFGASAAPVDTGGITAPSCATGSP